MRHRIKPSKWKGGKLRRMAKLVEFAPSESDLLEAFSVIFFTADTPAPNEVKSSIKAEDWFEANCDPAPDSKFKTVACPFCGVRIAKNPRIYTLKSGRGADFVVDDKVFEYVAGRFDKWTQIVDPSLKRPFVELRERFDAAKSRRDLDDFDKIKAHIAARDGV